MATPHSLADEDFVLVPEQIAEPTVLFYPEEDDFEYIVYRSSSEEDEMAEAPCFSSRSKSPTPAPAPVIDVDSDEYSIISDEEVIRHGLPEASHCEKNRQVWLWKFEKQGNILVECGSSRDLHQIPVKKVPTTSKVLQDVLQKAPRTRNIWIKDIETEDLAKYLDTVDHDTPAETIGSSYSWMDIAKLFVVADKVDDSTVQIKAQNGLKHKAVLRGKDYKLLFDDAVVHYVYGYTNVRSPLRMTLVEIAVFNRQLIGALNVPKEFYDDCKIEMSIREAVVVNPDGSTECEVPSVEVSRDFWGRHKGFVLSKPKIKAQETDTKSSSRLRVLRILNPSSWFAATEKDKPAPDRLTMDLTDSKDGKVVTPLIADKPASSGSPKIEVVIPPPMVELSASAKKLYCSDQDQINQKATDVAQKEVKPTQTKPTATAVLNAIEKEGPVSYIEKVDGLLDRKPKPGQPVAVVTPMRETPTRKPEPARYPSFVSPDHSDRSSRGIPAPWRSSRVPLGGSVGLARSPFNNEQRRSFGLVDGSTQRNALGRKGSQTSLRSQAVPQNTPSSRSNSIRSTFSQGENQGLGRSNSVLRRKGVLQPDGKIAPARQPRVPPSVEELKKAPTRRFPGSKNFLR